AVDEVRAESGLRDDLTGDRVDLLRRHPGPHRPHGRGLRALQYRVRVRHVGIAGFPHSVGARAVGVVALGDWSADVDHHHVTGLDHPIGHVVVWAGPVGPGTDDHEVGVRVALGDD